MPGEFLMAWEGDGTLDQWIGFCFDIEGDPFTCFNASMTFDESTEMWNDLFDYIDQKSAERNETIEMECVSDMWPGIDVPFDGDDDLHRKKGMNEYIPERFTSYAPMIYRCWYGEEIPLGGLMDPEDPWDTSYSAYAQLLHLQKSIPDEKMGFYIGITNTSCYARDWPQPEPYSWPTAENNSGFYNLMRDVLIAKHFGVKEITFFLAWTWIENNYSMGGVFESYGNDFLDRVNLTVNENPPDVFTIYYCQRDAVTSEHLQDDWLYNMNRLDGILEIAGICITSVVLVVLLPKYVKKREADIQ